MPEESNSSSRKAGVESGFVRVEFDAPTNFVGDIRHEYVCQEFQLHPGPDDLTEGGGSH